MCRGTSTTTTVATIGFEKEKKIIYLYLFIFNPCWEEKNVDGDGNGEYGVSGGGGVGNEATLVAKLL